MYALFLIWILLPLVLLVDVDAFRGVSQYMFLIKRIPRKSEKCIYQKEERNYSWYLQKNSANPEYINVKQLIISQFTNNNKLNLGIKKQWVSYS
jgi:hypothetical protein